MFLLYKRFVMFVLYNWKLSPKNVSYVISLFCVQWATVRADCSFCWYWWNCLSSLFKLSFLNSEETNQLVVNYYYSMDTMVWFLVFNATFSNISATCISLLPVLVVEEAGVPGENHRSWASNWLTLSLAAASRVHPFL